MAASSRYLLTILTVENQGLAGVAGLKTQHHIYMQHLHFIQT